MATIPDVRIRVCNDRATDRDGQFVLYWMSTCRRVQWNFALQRAVDWARKLQKPLVVVEVLCCGGRWDSDRHHRFVLDGMTANANRLARYPVLYYPYVEAKPGGGEELLLAVSRRASVVVTDEYPVTPPPDPAAAAGRVVVRMEQVDGNGLLPMRAADRVFPTAYAFRRFLQRVLPEHLLDAPKPNPLARAKLPRPGPLPKGIARRWPAASPELLGGETKALAALPIRHGVAPVETPGGAEAASTALRKFLKRRLPRYDQDRNQPEQEVTSGLSPYLHFGHISPHEVFHALARQEQWSPSRLSEKATGKREGWWGMGQPAEAFLDELVTWRELGLNFCWQRDDYDRYESLPDWARATLAEHAGDWREHVYTLEGFESARTHDPLWNAAQRQLVREGRLHNYLRMLWGKKILQWTADPRESLDVMIHLNNQYALDGQDPNSYSGILWVLGRYDRPWGPERPVFGKIRYMSSENTARKVRVKNYIARYAADSGILHARSGSDTLTR